MTESKFSYTGKLNGDLFTVRGDTAQEFAANMQAAVSAIQAATQLQSSLSGSPVVQSPMQQAVETLNNAGLAVTPVPQGIEVLKDKFGNEWTYGHPDAPDLPDGRGKYAKKKGTSKAGKIYTGWFDPAKGPKPFKPGAVEAETIWAK